MKKNKIFVSFALVLAAVAICFVARAASLMYQAQIYTASGNPLLIQTGYGCTGTLNYSSNAFPVAYASNPTVLTTQFGVTNSITNNIFVTNNYFLLTNGGINISNNWMAVGAPAN